jgi:hypothetical protein
MVTRTELNHRHADFQSQAEIRNFNCINLLTRAPVQRMPTMQDRTVDGSLPSDDTMQSGRDV